MTATQNTSLIPQVPTVQILMTDSAMDYASTVERTTPWGDNFLLNDGFLIVDPDTHEFSVTVPTRLAISGGISLTRVSGTTSRNNIEFRWQVLRDEIWGTVGLKHRSNYMRNATRHTLVSQEFPLFVIELAPGERLRMRHDQIAGTGGVERRDGSAQSYIQFLKLS